MTGISLVSVDVVISLEVLQKGNFL